MPIKTFIKTFDAEAQIAQIETILTTKRKQWFNRNKYVNILKLSFAHWNLRSLKLTQFVSRAGSFMRLVRLKPQGPGSERGPDRPV